MSLSDERARGTSSGVAEEDPGDSDEEDEAEVEHSSLDDAAEVGADVVLPVELLDPGGSEEDDADGSEDGKELAAELGGGLARERMAGPLLIRVVIEPAAVALGRRRPTPPTWFVAPTSSLVSRVGGEPPAVALGRRRQTPSTWSPAPISRAGGVSGLKAARTAGNPPLVPARPREPRAEALPEFCMGPFRVCALSF